MFRKVILVCMMAVTTLAHAAVTELTCVQTAPTEYKLSFKLTDDSHKVEISASTDPTGATGMQRIRETSSTQVTVTAGKPGQRMYFFLKPDHGDQREVSIRHLALEGTPNFRDLGGYETKDHHFVRWGVLYRSGLLTYLTANDLRYLAPLGIRVVCDFRTGEENRVAPEKWVDDPKVDHVSVPIGSDPKKQGKDASVSQVSYADLTPEQARQQLIGVYGTFAISAAPQYSEVFKQLLNDHLPLLYHCTAGKDRTGVFSALVLLTLGVPEATVLKDYNLTDKYLLDAGDSDANRKMMQATASNAMTNASPGTRKVMMAADPAYLAVTLRQIDQKYGSFDEYRRQVLHVSDEDVIRLRARLLE